MHLLSAPPNPPGWSACYELGLGTPRSPLGSPWSSSSPSVRSGTRAAYARAPAAATSRPRRASSTLAPNPTTLTPTLHPGP
eukprot:1445421-Prymnesium_polylepis.2